MSLGDVLKQYGHGIPCILTALLSGLAASCLTDQSPQPGPAEIAVPDLTPPVVALDPRRPARGSAPVATPPADGVVDAAWVDARLGTDAIRVVDLRPAANFRQGHLPGAISDPWGRSLLAGAPAPPGTPSTAARLVARRMQLVPTPRTVVLVHCGRDVRDHAVAARAWLLLYAAGLPASQLAILRGGYGRWRKEGWPLVSTPSRPSSTLPAPAAPKGAPAAASRATPRLRPFLLLGPGALAEALKDPNTRVLRVRDARPNGPSAAMGAPPRKPRPDQPALVIPAYFDPLRRSRRPVPVLRAKMAALLAGRQSRRLILHSPRGLWAALLWVTLKTVTDRPDRLNLISFGSEPNPPVPPREAPPRAPP